MKIIKNWKKILIFLLFFPISFISANTFVQNGIVFVEGKSNPERRVFKEERKYKNIKALEVIKRVEKGIDLKREDTEEFIEANKIKTLEQSLDISSDTNFDFFKPLGREPFSNKKNDILKKEKKSSNGILDKLIEIIKDIWKKIILIQKNITNIFIRLSVIEEKLNIKKEQLTIKNDENNLVIEEEITEKTQENEQLETENTQEVDLKGNDNADEEVESEENSEESFNSETENENVDSENQEEEEVVGSNDEEVSNTDSENTGDNMDNSESQDESNSDEGIDDSGENSSGEESDQDNSEESQEQKESSDSENQTTTTETTE